MVSALPMPRGPTMSLAEVPAPTTTMTVEEFLALPDDGIERELIKGELRERPMTLRNPMHSKSMMCIGHLLLNWLETQKEPRGEIVGGEAAFRLKQQPRTLVGIDVAYAS